jgi:hypothetical protein
MTLLFVLICSGIFLGGMSLWFSGLLLGSIANTAKSDEELKNIKLLKEENLRITQLADNAVQTNKSLKQIQKQTEEQNSAAKAEVSRLSVEIGLIEGEKLRLEAKIAGLEKEISALKQKKKESLPKLPVKTSYPLKTESEAIDEIQAQLDLERVAHQKTREELEQVKKIAAIKMGSSLPRGKRQRGFQTMSISTRNTNQNGTEKDLLQKSLLKMQDEKDKIEAELNRARQEIQILKMRQ